MQVGRADKLRYSFGPARLGDMDWMAMGVVIGPGKLTNGSLEGVAISKPGVAFVTELLSPESVEEYEKIRGIGFGFYWYIYPAYQIREMQKSIANDPTFPHCRTP
jgi:carbohydrate-binding DOMON domain-containing protein